MFMQGNLLQLSAWLLWNVSVRKSYRLQTATEPPGSPSPWLLIHLPEGHSCAPSPHRGHPCVGRTLRTPPRASAGRMLSFHARVRVERRRGRGWWWEGLGGGTTAVPLSQCHLPPPPPSQPAQSCAPPPPPPIPHPPTPNHSASYKDKRHSL